MFAVQGSGLEKMYWDHVALFPSHSPMGFKPRLDELTDALAYGFAGEVSSANSAEIPNYNPRIVRELLVTERRPDSEFPFAVEEISASLNVIEQLDGEQHQIYLLNCRLISILEVRGRMNSPSATCLVGARLFRTAS